MTARAENRDQKGVVELRKLLEKYETDPETFAHLTMDLYEVYDDCGRFREIYERMFDLPPEPEKEREHLAELLVDGKVRLGHLIYHASEVISLMDRLVDNIDRDDQ